MNTGGFDPADAVADQVAGLPNAWLHVDGAFGLWVSASPRLRHLTTGLERADSWSTDAHKWLNAGYDCGFVAVRDVAAHRAAMSATAAYLMQVEGHRDPWEYVVDSSRRARGFAVYAAIRSLGRSGVADLLDRCCALARRMADLLDREPGVAILNDLVLNQCSSGSATTTNGPGRSSLASRRVARPGWAAPRGTARPPCDSA